MPSIRILSSKLFTFTLPIKNIETALRPQVALGSPPPMWGGGKRLGGGFGREDESARNGPVLGRGSGQLGGGRSGGSAGSVSQRRHSAGNKQNGKFPPPPPPGALMAQTGQFTPRVFRGRFTPTV